MNNTFAKKSINYILIFILTAISVTHLWGQSVETINTDRPDQSDGVYTVPKHSLQIESGILFAKGTLLNNTMIRYGATNSTELRLLVDFGKADNDIGFFPLGISAKQRIIEQEHIIPSITIVGYLYLPKISIISNKNLPVTGSILLALQNEISDRHAIGYNIGTSTLFQDLNLSISWEILLTDKLSCFLEYFSHLEHNSSPEHNIDSGFLYLLSNNAQIDIAFGRPIYGEFEQFVTIGFSYKIR